MSYVVIDGERVSCTFEQLKKIDELAAKRKCGREEAAAEALGLKKKKAKKSIKEG